MLTYEQAPRERATGADETHHPDQTPARGRVFLVGAGPGDAELITVKGLRCLRAANVVVYDRLIDPTLLDEARSDAERIYVGKGPRCHAMKQEAINALLISQARQGKIVVRLKGGDPFVFGRGGEEALALAGAGVPFEVVPGVSSAVAVPAYAGTPVTHRGYAPQVTIVTGHEATKEQGAGTEQHSADPVNWEVLARVGGTLVILMGVRALPCITRRLLDGGLDRETPAAVIQQGTTQQQRVVTGTLATIAQHAADASLESPAITVVGAVAGLRESLAWFELAQTRDGAW
ncbi:MAG: uroporphyrinogen-III C-methyltransferase [Ktedonobacterales bacterium]